MLNAIKSVLADISSFSPSSEQRLKTLKVMLACKVCYFVKPVCGQTELLIDMVWSFLLTLANQNSEERGNQ